MLSPTSVQVTVHSYPLGHGHIQTLCLVVVLGGERGLQPVVDVDAPGRVGFAQLVELAQVLEGHPNAVGLAVLQGPHLPVVLTAVHTHVT